MSHPIDEAVQFDDADFTERGGTVHTATHPKFDNMVGPFGGITAAQMIAAVEAHPQAQGRPIAETLNFTSPLAYGPFDIELDLVQTNNSNQHWNIAVRQGDKRPVTGSIVLGSRRESFADREVSAPEVQAPKNYEPSVSPTDLTWLNNYELRFDRGGYSLGEEKGDSESVYWLRHAEPRGWDTRALASAADTFFPRIFLRTGKLSPAATITLTTYFLGTDEEYEAAGDFVLCQGRAQRFGGGVSDQLSRIFSSDGDLLVSAHQLMYFRG